MPFDPTTGVYSLPTGNNPPFPGQLISTNTLTAIINDIATALSEIPASAIQIKIGVTPVAGGTDKYLLFNNGGLLGNEQTVPVVNGGTGLPSLTAHAVLLGEGTGNVAFAAIGTSGRLLIDQGSGADPTFNAISGDATITHAGVISVSADSNPPSYTVATLPAGVQGARAYVTDATAPTFLGTLVGGGSTKCPVFYNGAAWVPG